MSEALKDGGPAFPTHWPTATSKGATLRDYFAGKALQGMLANGHPHAQSDEFMYARDAYTLADAMLLEREK